MSNERHFSGWQSAVSGIQAENISIGDINQSIIHSSNSRYNHIGVIISEYNRNVARSEKSFKDRSRANQKNMQKELQNCLQDLHRQAKVCQQAIEEHEKKIKGIEKYGGLLIDIHEKKTGSLFNKDSAYENAKDAAIPGVAAYLIYQEDKGKKEEEAELEETKQNISELKYLIAQVEGFLRSSFPEELDIDQILDDESLNNLSSHVKENIESIKDSFRSQQRDLKDSYDEELNRYRTERNISIYREELQYCLDEDGYPLSSSKMRFVESRLRSFNLDQEDVKSITEEIVEPLCVENLKTYKVAYQEKLHQDGYPLSEDSVEKLEAFKEKLALNAFFDEDDIESIVEEIIRPFAIQNLENYKVAYQEKLDEEGYPLSEESIEKLKLLKEKLALNAFRFLRLETKSTEENLVRPFYQINFQEYQKNYRVKLEEKGLTLRAEDLIQLEELQTCLGLKTFIFSGFNVREAEKELIELVYRENVQKYEQECKKKLLQEGFPLSLNAIRELSSLEKTLGLGSFQFLDCSDPVSIKRELVRPLYKANLQAYSQEYKQKLYQFGVNFPQVNTAELEELRGRFGFDIRYLETLGLQALFDLEEISAIESELVKLVYRENLQSYEQEYKQKLDKEGFSLSYSTISGLSHLEEVLGLGGYQLQDYPELKQIKAQWIRPFYQSNLQNYSKEYKRRLGQFGIDFAKNNTSELGELRSEFGLTFTHLKNLNLQDRFFSLDSDLFILEKNARESFYIESLQSYVQELKRESNNHLTDSLKESLQALGIRSEDVKVVEGITRNNWGITHLFHERDSDASYWKLINALAQSEWQKADALTRNLLLKLADRSSKGFLDKEAIEKTATRDVYTLDLLWVEYSKERFGFSVQKKIYKQVDRKKQPFAEAVGWSNQAGIFGIFAWKSYSELDFTINAPKGHLPVWRVKGKEISVDDFSHLKIWHFKDNEPEIESLVDADDSKPDSSKTNILSQSFQKIFESINQFEIKQKVDKMGIDGFINECAILAATTGAASGFGGFATMIVGVPFDVLNNVLQQFRVTLGVIYHKKGVHKVSFAELITIVGVSIGVEVGATLTKSVMINIANKILVQLSASTAGKAVPFLGAAIGGLVNYGFVRAIGAAVKRIDMSTHIFQSEGEKQ